MQWFGWATALTRRDAARGDRRATAVGLAATDRRSWSRSRCIPVAVAIVMAGTRRFAARIDRILAHTVSLAGLTGIVVVVYLVVVLGLATPPHHKCRDHVLLGLSMAAAAIAALIYGPARQRLGQIANRIVYGEREAPDAVLRTFGSRLSRAIPMDELLLQVAESLRKTLALSGGGGVDGLGGPARAHGVGPRRPRHPPHDQRRGAARRGPGRGDRHRLARGLAARHVGRPGGLDPARRADDALGPGPGSDRGRAAAGRRPVHDR